MRVRINGKEYLLLDQEKTEKLKDLCFSVKDIALSVKGNIKCLRTWAKINCDRDHSEYLCGFFNRMIRDISSMRKAADSMNDMF